jgi:hypothetical protein
VDAIDAVAFLDCWGRELKGYEADETLTLYCFEGKGWPATLGTLRRSKRAGRAGLSIRAPSTSASTNRQETERREDRHLGVQPLGHLGVFLFFFFFNGN